MKRKRSQSAVRGRPPKRAQQGAGQSGEATPATGDHPVLRRIYPDVSSLRHYLLSRLPASSKNRRRKISQLGLPAHDGDATATRDVDRELGRLLDSTLVGLSPKAIAASREEAAKARDRDLESFSQQVSEHATGSTFNPGYFLQTEVGSITCFPKKYNLKRMKCLPCSSRC